jgi:hypothetical protein
MTYRYFSYEFTMLQNCGFDFVFKEDNFPEICINSAGYMNSTGIALQLSEF